MSTLNASYLNNRRRDRLNENNRRRIYREGATINGNVHGKRRNRGCFHSKTIIIGPPSNDIPSTPIEAFTFTNRIIDGTPENVGRLYRLNTETRREQLSYENNRNWTGTVSDV